MTTLNPLHAELAALRDENDGLKAVLEALREHSETAVGRLASHYGIPATAARVLNVLADGRIHNKSGIPALCAKSDEIADLKWVDVYICKIRKGIGYDAIKTHWGIGYSLTPDALAEVRRVIKGETP